MMNVIRKGKSLVRYFGFHGIAVAAWIVMVASGVSASVDSYAVAQSEGVTWEIERDVADGTLASGENAVVPCTEGWDAYNMNVVKETMTWRRDPAPRFTYPDVLASTPDHAYSNSLATAQKGGYGNAGLSLANAVTKLALTNGFTIECYLKIEAGSPQWSRIVELQRAPTYNQYTNGFENSFAFLLQQATVATAGGKVSLQLRIDPQSPATNRWEVGGQFNGAFGVQSVKVGEWCHWAFAYDAQTHQVKTWSNGQAETVSQLPRAMQFDDTDNPLVFGDRMTGSVGFIRYSPRVLGVAELLPNALASMSDAVDEPVRCWWRFENGVTGVSVDPGTVTSSVNAVWWSGQRRVNTITYTNDVPAVRMDLYMGDERLARGNTRSVVLTNGYIQLTQTRAAAVTNFTVECFIRDLGGSCQYATVLQRARENIVYTDGNGVKTEANGLSAWCLAMGNPGLRLRFDTVPRTDVKPVNGVNWNQCYDGKIDVRDGRWHHAALTFDSGAKIATLYIDYKKDGSMTTAYPMPVDAGSVLIGVANATTTRALNMEIDEVRVTSEVLPPTKFLRFQNPAGLVIYVQ